MASRFDLEPRIAALQDKGLAVTSDYKGAPPQWLTTSLDGCDVRVVNTKGTKPDDVVVMIKLSKLEELVAASAGAVE